MCIDFLPTSFVVKSIIVLFHAYVCVLLCLLTSKHLNQTAPLWLSELLWLWRISSSQFAYSVNRIRNIGPHCSWLWTHFALFQSNAGSLKWNEGNVVSHFICAGLFRYSTILLFRIQYFEGSLYVLRLQMLFVMGYNCRAMTSHLECASTWEYQVLWTRHKARKGECRFWRWVE